MSAKQETIVSDVTIIGAGFAGLASIHRLRKDGLTVNAIESGNDIGGTWFWNRYPGAVCDVESMIYTYEFDSKLLQDWNWSQKYSGQAEILAYLNEVADRHDLRKHIFFNQIVQKCIYSEMNSSWTIYTNTGHTYISPMLILATGSLSEPNKPKYDGIDQFKGYLYYTSKWPKNPVDFSDKKVAIIGTGSTGVQCIPKLAEMAQHLTVYQRTAQYVFPLRNRKLEDKERQMVKDNYDEILKNAKNHVSGAFIKLEDGNAKMFDDMTIEEYENELWHRWNITGGIAGVFWLEDQTTNRKADFALAQFIRNRIHEIVKDSVVADRLCPSVDQFYSCKRPLFGTNYFETYNRNNVELVSISETRKDGTPIKCMTSNGIITCDGIERECDVLIFATGFDALTGAILNINIEGINKQTIQDCWKDGPKTYLGLQTVGFPNMFTICGPHSPSVFANMVRAIEQHVNWIADLIVYMKKNNLKCVEPTESAQQEWVEFNNATAAKTLYGSPTCNSWYLGSNIKGKKRHFLPCLMGLDKYTEKCNDVTNQKYIGFDFDLRARKKRSLVLSKL